LSILENLSKRKACKLTALIGIEYLGAAVILQGFFLHFT